MRDFIDQLDDRLQAMATEEPEHARPARAAAKRHRRRRPAALAGLTATLATLGTVFAMSGTSLADLPILDTPTTDATTLRDEASGARKAGVDFTKAHTFRTPGGRGYVFLTPARDVLCVSVPLQGRYPGACAPRGRVEREGLSFESVGDLAVNPDATSTFVFILPEGATDVHLVTEAGTRRRADVESGVVTTRITTRTRVIWTSDDRSASKTFEGPFGAGGTTSFQCRDGRTVATPAEGSTVPGPSGRIKPEIVKRLCG